VVISQCEIMQQDLHKDNGAFSANRCLRTMWGTEHMVRNSPGSGTHLVVNETHLVLDLTWTGAKIVTRFGIVHGCGFSK
jgi:hypothetical protein